MRIRALPVVMLAGFALLSAGFTASADAGATLVGATIGGHLVEVDASGAIDRVIAGPEVTGGQVGGIAVSGTDVYFARHDPDVGLPCDATLARVPFAGGRAETISRGFAPALSADGRWLAHVVAEPGGAGCDFAVRVLDLVTSEARTWALEGQWSDVYGVCTVAWAPSGQHLAVELCSEADSVMHVLAVAGSGPLGDETFAGPLDGSLSWGTPASGPTGDQVAVVERCCLTTNPLRVDQRIRILGVEGSLRIPVPAGAGWTRSLDVRPNGQAVVVAGGRGRLLVSKGDRLQAIGEGFVSARWLSGAAGARV